MSKIKNGKLYEEVEFGWGNTIEGVVNLLLEYKIRGKLVYGEFNQHYLYSDTVDMDVAYKAITGKTKTEFDEGQRKSREDVERRDREHEDKIPELEQYWMKRGKEVLAEDKWKLWDEIVPVRLRDLYQGMELGNCLSIVEILGGGQKGDVDTLEVAKKEIDRQNHSGMSYGLVCSMVGEFSDRGKEFVEYVQ
ncbi:hypothetical protein CIL05_06950 [Virgibacillus profundi]|uniref:Uncharacterized protein n=1 Tax=Virgibacillus profundi TaxID=2024555 RepID=A0A2A2IEX8_9BACI|nr:hypothetical protein [Virgibacillus profundi]PAV30197.1 hypothetical protein CIL05_06950 [Virgibacillus profundi]PXY54369.1 hypothetical protein CIT14_07035 [Virgibacillus profundi]